jgi:hypothetical protein
VIFENIFDPPKAEKGKEGQRERSAKGKRGKV